jgi:hypothetical protein
MNPRDQTARTAALAQARVALRQPSFVTIGLEPTVNRKSRLTVGTASPWHKDFRAVHFAPITKDFAPARYWRDQSGVTVLCAAFGDLSARPRRFRRKTPSVSD